MKSILKAMLAGSVPLAAAVGMIVRGDDAATQPGAAAGTQPATASAPASQASTQPATRPRMPGGGGGRRG